MFQDDDIDLSKHFQARAIEFLDKNVLPATPINYAVSYAYVSRRNIALVSDIAKHAEQEKCFDSDVMEGLFNRYFTNRDAFENEMVAPFDTMMAEVLKKMTVQVDAEKQFAHDLAQVDQQIEASECGIQAVATSLSAIASKARATHDTLASELTRATDEINQLKSKLEETKKLAITDTLTGLMNRRGFEQQLECLDYGDSCACLLLDIDHFKNFNDTFGHFIGDHVLKRVAKEIKDNVRGRDVSVRFGGEEFLILLVDTPLVGAKKVAETIRNTVAGLRLVQKKSKQPLPPINVSVGIAMHQEDEEWDSLVKRADSALYYAKKQGRNQSVFSQPINDRDVFEVVNWGC